MNLVKMITVPQWELVPGQGWAISKVSLWAFLEMATDPEGVSFWTFREQQYVGADELLKLAQVSPAVQNRVNSLWELLEHYKKITKVA